MTVITEIHVREAVRDDGPAIESLYPKAFPDEDLLPLVRELAQAHAIVVSLVGTAGLEVVGHAMFTMCGIAGTSARAALLAPLAVAPAWQRRGIGSAIVRAGLQRLKDEQVRVVLVLGDPAYYGRLGFEPESSIEPPYELPPEWAGAWQSQYLDAAGTSLAGRLIVPPQWRQPALWGP